jgi:hypothetical protein
VDGSFTGSAYGTSDGVVGLTHPAEVAPVLEAVPLAVAARVPLAPAGAAPPARNDTTVATAMATVGSLPGYQGTFLDLLR